MAGVGNLSSVFLLPILIYYFHLGITGAAIATVVSQYVPFTPLSLFLNVVVGILSYIFLFLTHSICISN